MSSLYASNGEITLESLMDRQGDAICYADDQMRILAATQSFARFYGMKDPAELLGKTPFDVYPGFKSSVFYQACLRTLETGEPSQRQGYSYNLSRWIVVRCQRLSENRYVMTVSFPPESSTKLGTSKHDSLTSLPNRYAFEEDVESLPDTGSMCAVLLDISHFRNINETLDYSAGDRCLMEMGARMRQAVLRNDRLYRLGNDQFVVLGSNDPESVATRRQSLERELSAPWFSAGREFLIRFNMGVSMSGAGVPAAKMLTQAEQALAVAKVTNGYAEFNESMSGTYDPSLYKELRDALAKDQFVAYFQPQVDLIDGKTCGAESLVRWVHPVRGIVPPLHFLPFAEDSGLIREIDRVVARKTLQEIAYLQSQNKTLPISLNLSAKTLCDLSIVDFMYELLNETKVNPSLVGIEITETAVMSDIETSRAVIEAFKNMGFHISIDDFGSGYSSMAYLLRYPSDFLKIDREFIKDVGKGGTHQGLVKNLINLAHSLGIGVVAEGIESQADAMLLRSLKCDVGQGYHFARPLSKEDFREWVEEKALTTLASMIR